MGCKVHIFSFVRQALFTDTVHPKCISNHGRINTFAAEKEVLLIIIIIIIGSYLAHFHTVQCAISIYISPYASLKSSVIMDDLNSDKVFK